ncbi:glycosyltransferase family 9 protein [Acetobacter sp.]|uniref:glycosyltransferase family 9 protein n=1 Tax=Acetobacter sp. TaxID=440 RepID=UPI0039E8E76D
MKKKFDLKKISNRLQKIAETQDFEYFSKEMKKYLDAYPEWADGYALLGHVLAVLNKTDEAGSAYGKAFSLNQKNIDWKINALTCQLATNKFGIKPLEELLDLFMIHVADLACATKIAAAMATAENPKIVIAALKWREQNYPSSPKLTEILGRQLIGAGLIAEGCEVYKNLFAQNPDNIIFAEPLASALISAGSFEACLNIIEGILQTHPHMRQSLLNEYGLALYALNRSDEAEKVFREYLQAAPSVRAVEYNLMLALLKSGQYSEGWKFRELTPDEYKRNNFKNPWLGDSSIYGKTLLVYWEQGMGDVIQFIRYVPFLERKGAKVIVSVPQPLERLAQSISKHVQIVGPDESGVAYDVSCSILSLPLALVSQLGGNIPASIPYLYPEKQNIEESALWLPDWPGLRVGIVWAGENRPRRGYNYRSRSINLNGFRPIIEVPGACFINLQFGQRREELKNWAGPEIFDPMDHVEDMEDTAAIIAHLDLVITVDTSVAHLAGAMGKPVWMLTRSDCCWRWQENRDDSPWYPTMRIFRSQPGSLSHAVNLAAAVLPKFIAEHAGQKQFSEVE